jgi:O-acetylhomoserine/O-acetylserine sulfhydrylase-like pyridoxal-dependent enzyme
MNMVKIKLLNNAEIFINTENVNDVRSDVINPKHTVIQLNQGTHKVHLPVADVLKLLGAKDIL